MPEYTAEELGAIRVALEFSEQNFAFGIIKKQTEIIAELMARLDFVSKPVRGFVSYPVFQPLFGTMISDIVEFRYDPTTHLTAWHLHEGGIDGEEQAVQDEQGDQAQHQTGPDPVGVDAS